MQAEFIINGESIKVEFKEKETLEDIFPRFKSKYNKNLDIRSTSFLYNGAILETSIPLSKIISHIDRANRKLCILVVDKNGF